MSNKATPATFVSIQTTAFSGATLLATLLAAHPEIATIGEMNGLIAREDPASYLCSCGLRITACAFWQAVGAEMLRRGHSFDAADFSTQFALGGPRVVQYLRKRSFKQPRLNALRDALFAAWPGEAQRIKLLVARNEALIASVLAVTGKRVFVDTSKDRLRLLLLRRYSALDLRAIHLVRDVRGVVASRLRRGATIDAREAARQWATLHERIRRTLSALPSDRRIQIGYEQVCRDARGTLAQLDRFCGVDPERRPAALWSETQHIVGNEMRLKQLAEVRLDERWRSMLSAEQLVAIRRAAGATSLRYGYR